MSEVVIEAMEMMKYDTANSPPASYIENIDPGNLMKFILIQRFKIIWIFFHTKVNEDSLKENKKSKKSKDVKKRKKRRDRRSDYLQEEEEGWLMIPVGSNNNEDTLGLHYDSSPLKSVSQSLPENVAMSILSRYSDDILPFVSNVHLPMTPDGAKLRGTVDWAPPRPQLIYNSYGPPKDIDLQLKLQKWRCPGCGSDVSF